MIDWRPARMPGAVALSGDTVVLDPLDVDRHGEDLFAATAGAEATWSYLPYGPFATKEDFHAWLRWLVGQPDGMAYAVIPCAGSIAQGVATFMCAVPDHGVIEIGRIWLSPPLQRTSEATEAIYLMCRHAFEELGNRRLEWRCNAENVASRRAAERFGFVFEGIFRQHRVAKGRSRDTAWFSILDYEWPVVRAAFEAWLAPANFDPSGQQRRRLADMRASIAADALDPAPWGRV